MRELERLIAELCPEGVEYVTVGDICDITRGRVMSKDYLRDNEGIYPVYSSQTANNGVFGYINTFDYSCESVTWTTDGANAGSVFYHVREKFSITNVCGLLRVKDDDRVSMRFAYYALQVSAKDYVNDGMGNPKLMSNVMARVALPLPPLPVQHEIVRILDHFTELTAELTAELAARKKQYEYYRNELLTFGDVKWKKLKEVGIMIRGTYVTKKDTVHGDIPVILGGQEPAYFCSISNHEGEAIVMSRSGAYAGFVSFWDEPIYVTDGFIIETGKELKTKYLFYYLKNIQDTLHQMKRGGGVPHVRGSEIMEIQIPLPPLEEQARIVAILDRFDALTTDITVGLPAEIAARQKQYEHYQDKLLTFKEAGS